MLISPLLRPILYDESFARMLGDAEARILFEWVYDHAERLVRAAEPDAALPSRVGRLHRRARAIAQFVHLWCERRDRGAAGQLASAERFGWPMPTPKVDSCVLMERILRFEDRLESRPAA